MRCLLISLIATSVVFSQTEGPTGGVSIRDEPPGGANQAKAPPLSPPSRTSVTINGQKITIKYGAPSMRKRVIFGGLVPYHKVWRAGANVATLLQTTSDVELNGLLVPKGEYSLYVWLDPQQWLLIVNKQTGQSGLDYNQQLDLGRVPMDMSRPPKAIERFKITLTKTAPMSGQLTLAWENTIAMVDFVVRTPP